jgi:hypothetical protein
MSGMSEGIPQVDLRLLTAQIVVFALAAFILVIATKGQLGHSSDLDHSRQKSRERGT